ncbi:hybrid sensor histidine kinase/response regulator [Gloeocapsopsis dulcis]|uniref:histidine kinase n=1 Tax=Gloeocapsopsis dulcis AAB1 = 1H9 TaxID=1433147 RepID=A0A6N8FVB0_9CHRO|nr:hybrid sensor histidine kinase/response regulator [Gloeocapsopsis dulcis]MUL37058.1 hybrid sensor histidine kinase/response regulator [Gloeocapsopsis dulcis AAB1 = 1H9]WNN87912.1 hybrid sensor histidine kinase/response regulator [Gloeocapsopsis dulcis]
MVKDKELEIRLSFLEEAQDYLNTIETGIMVATAQQDRQQMDAVLRAAHSIKGGAAMMGFPILSDLAHRLEDFFKVLKTQQLLVDAELENLLLASVGCLRQAIAIYHQGNSIDEQWQENHTAPIFSQLQQRLGNVSSSNSPELLSPEDGQMQALVFETEVEEYLQRLESILADPQHPGLLEETTAIAQDFASLGQMFQIPAFQSLCESISQNLTAFPERVVEIASLALQEWRRSQTAILLNQGTIPSTIPININDNSLTTAQAEIEVLFDLLSPELTEENYQPELNPTLASIDPQQPAQDTEKKSLHLVANSSLDAIEQDKTVRVSVDLLEQLNDLFGELTIERNGINLYIERLRNLVKILDGRVHSIKNFDTRLFTVYENNYLRSNAANTFNSAIEEDSFANQFTDGSHELRAFTDEVMESIFRIQEVANDISISIEDTTQAVSELNRTAKQMQTGLTQVRMRPLSDLLNRFPRFLRELSLQYNKKVELKIQGGETLIERNILEALNDPLMHLLRNAFDHGIEDLHTRRSHGKPEQGTIEIKATTRGNQTFISISDDGQGIDLTKVRTKAQQLGLNSTALTNTSEQELLTLIFEPGFSTANQVTNLSGRGVGLDVVRTNLRKIRGDIKVDTQLGIGTTFHLNVPISLSIAKVILVESNNMLMAFPTDTIEEMLLLNSEHVTTIAGQEIFSWEGDTIPLLRLGQWLVFRGSAYKKSDTATAAMGVPTVLKVVQGHELVAIQVDRCWGEQEVAIRQVEGAIAMPPGFSSCTILGDGRVVPLVNPSALIQWIASCQQSALEQPEKANTQFPSHKDTVLVVDDSINVRRFLSLALEKAGYRIEEAIDGQDAIEKLSSGLQVKVVISDVDMPRLDGYSLLAQVKSIAHLKQIPFIMLTSRQGQRERQLATNLGAAAYFSKPFNEQELLQTLQHILT